MAGQNRAFCSALRAQQGPRWCTLARETRAPLQPRPRISSMMAAAALAQRCRHILPQSARREAAAVRRRIPRIGVLAVEGAQTSPEASCAQRADLLRGSAQDPRCRSRPHAAIADGDHVALEGAGSPAGRATPHLGAGWSLCGKTGAEGTQQPRLFIATRWRARKRRTCQIRAGSGAATSGLRRGSRCSGL